MPQDEPEIRRPQRSQPGHSPRGVPRLHGVGGLQGRLRRQKDLGALPPELQERQNVCANQEDLHPAREDQLRQPLPHL